MSVAPPVPGHLHTLDLRHRRTTTNRWRPPAHPGAVSREQSAQNARRRSRWAIHAKPVETKLKLPPNQLFFYVVRNEIEFRDYRQSVNYFTAPTVKETKPLTQETSQRLIVILKKRVNCDWSASGGCGVGERLWPPLAGAGGASPAACRPIDAWRQCLPSRGSLVDVFRSDRQPVHPAGLPVPASRT